jgi:hypothetical protein
MKFTVLWRQVAENKLANMWLHESDRAEVAAAADAVDQLLGMDPLAQGESREGNKRILLYPPLAVLYQVSVDDRIVHVLTIGRSKPRG